MVCNVNKVVLFRKRNVISLKAWDQIICSLDININITYISFFKLGKVLELETNLAAWEHRVYHQMILPLLIVEIIYVIV